MPMARMDTIEVDGSPMKVYVDAPLTRRHRRSGGLLVRPHLDASHLWYATTMQRLAGLGLPFFPAVVLAFGAAACSEAPCDPMTEACTFEARVSTLTVGAGHEDEDTCQS